MEIIREQAVFVPDGIEPASVEATVWPPGVLPAFRSAGTPGRWRADGGLEDVLQQILDGARDLTGADLGNIQLRDPATGGLRIAAQTGFGPDFLEHFALVTDDDSACGRAAHVRAQTVIIDVELDRDFAPHRAIAAASGFRSVTSTPLTDGSGSLVGMVSTHLRHPGRPAEHALRPLRVYARLAGELVARTCDLEQPLAGGALARAAEDAVNRIFAASLVLAGAQAAMSNTVWRERLEAATDELDQAVKAIQIAAAAAQRE
jgi:GAF domain-containing protein